MTNQSNHSGRPVLAENVRNGHANVLKLNPATKLSETETSGHSDMVSLKNVFDNNPGTKSGEMNMNQVASAKPPIGPKIGLYHKTKNNLELPGRGSASLQNMGGRLFNVGGAKVMLNRNGKF